MNTDIKESFEEIQKMCRFLSKKYTSEFAPPATEKELSDWENQNGINIPEQYRQWLLLTRNAYICGGCYYLFFPQIYENDDEYVFIGDIVGDGECLCFSRTDGAMYSDFDGEITEYNDFDDFLVYLSITLEDYARDLYGENWLEIFEQEN